MSVGLVVSFFNQINHDLTENNFCLLMASPAFEVPQGAASFEVFKHSGEFPSVCVCACVKKKNPNKKQETKKKKKLCSLLCLSGAQKHNN